MQIPNLPSLATNFYVIVAALMLVVWLLSKALGKLLDWAMYLVWGDDEIRPDEMKVEEQSRGLYRVK